MFGLGGASIKSVQRGEKTLAVDVTSDTVTISAVDTAKSIVLISFSTNSGTYIHQAFTKAVLTDSTTITFSRYTAANYSVFIAWQVVEFN